MHKDPNEKTIATFRAEGRPIFACHVQHLDAAWKELRDNFTGAAWSDVGFNHPDMTIYFSPAVAYGPEQLEKLKQKYSRFLLDEQQTKCQHQFQTKAGMLVDLYVCILCKHETRSYEEYLRFNNDR